MEITYTNSVDIGKDLRGNVKTCC